MVTVEVLRIVGLMRWAMYLQRMLVGLHVVSVVVAAVLLMSNHVTWLESFGSIAASCALYATSGFALDYQQRLRRALDEAVYDLRTELP